MKYKYIAYAILLCSGFLVCSEPTGYFTDKTIMNTPLNIDSTLSTNSNVQIGSQVSDKVAPGAPSFLQDFKEIDFYSGFVIIGFIALGYVAIHQSE